MSSEIPTVVDNTEDETGYETIWSCDVCKVASFPSFEEAVRHESKCKGRRKVPENAAPAASENDDGEAEGSSSGSKVTAAEKWTCDVCLVTDFGSYKEAVEHEKTCAGPKTTSPDGRTLEKGRVIPHEPSGTPAVNKALWTCDMCQSLHFDTYEEAALHEGTCKGRKMVRCGTENVAPKRVEERVTEAKLEAVYSASKDPRNAECKGSRESPKDHKSDEKAQITTSHTVVVWTCDVCKVLEFLTFEEAAEHERTCQGVGPDAGAGSAASAAASYLPLLTLSPLIRGERDSPNYSALSPYDVMLLGAVDLIENRSSIRAVGFRCHFCEKVLPGPWTVQTMSLLQSALYILLPTLTEIMKLKPSTEKTSLEKFARTLFSQNGIAQVKASPKAKEQLVILDLNASEMATGCRRRQWMASMDDPPDNGLSSLIQPPVPDHDSAKKSIFQDGFIPVLHSCIPVLHSCISSYCSQLSSFNQVALAQFILAPKDICSLEGNIFCRLELQCRHCRASSGATSIAALHKACYALAHSHILKTCPHVPSPVRAMLHCYQKSRKSGAVCGGSLGLRVYWEHLCKALYLVDTESGFGIRQSNFTQNVSKMWKEQEEKSSNTDQKRHALITHDSSNKETKRRRLDQPKTRPPAKSIVYTDDNGFSINLPPAGGVPLLSSLTTLMASKLCKYDCLILDQMELYENVDASYPLFLSVRCQNCKCEHEMRPPGASKQLSNIKTWFKTVMEIGKHHIPRCTFLGAAQREAILKAHEKGAHTSVSLRSYCDHLTKIYCMDRHKGASGSGVVWGICAPIVKGYTGPDPLRTKDKVRGKPFQHDLMVPHFGESKKELSTSTISQCLILSDYAYLLVSQLELVSIERKSSFSPKGFNKYLGRTRQPKTLSPPSERSSLTRTDLVVPPPSDAVGLRCTKCHLTKPIPSLHEFTRNMLSQCHHHLKKCPNVLEPLKSLLIKSKGLQVAQRSSVNKSLSDYIKMVFETYELRDLEWNGVSSAVAFGNSFLALNEKYGETGGGDCKYKYALPLLLGQFVQPITVDLPYTIGAVTNGNPHAVVVPKVMQE